MKRLIALLFCLALSSCGGGGGDIIPPAQATDIPAPKPVQLHPGCEPFPSQLQVLVLEEGIHPQPCQTDQDAADHADDLPLPSRQAKVHGCSSATVGHGRTRFLYEHGEPQGLAPD